MVDQAFHRMAHDLGDVLGGVAQTVRPHFEIGGPGQLLVRDHDGPRAELLEPIDALRDDLERLAHLLDPDDVPPVRVAPVVGDDIEIVCLVTAVRLGLAQVVRQARRAQHRPGDAQRDTPREVEIADADRAGLPDVVLVEQILQVAQPFRQQFEQPAHLCEAVTGQVGGKATGPDVGVVHPQPGDGLKDLQDFFAFPEPIEHRAHRTEFHAAGGQCHQMRGDPVEFHHHHPDDAGAFGDVVGDAEQLLHTQAVRGLVEKRRQIVHPGDERGALRPVAVLQVLLDPGVQIADAATGFGDDLAFDLQDEPQHAVGGGVLRTHVHHDALAGLGTRTGLGRGDHLVPICTADDYDGFTALGRDGGCAHQLYDLRWSGGGIWAPWYSTGTPPRG